MKNTNKNSFVFLSIIIGVMATMLILFPALTLKDSETTFTGLEVAFGHEFASLGSLASGEISLNILVILAYALPAIAALFILLTNRLSLLSTLAFIAGAVMIFLIPQFTEVTVTLLGTPTVIEVSWTYAIGSILAAALCIVGGIIGLLKSTKS